MNINKIIVAFLLILCLSSVVSAADTYVGDNINIPGYFNGLLNWSNITNVPASQTYNVTYQNNTITTLTYFNQWMSTFNATYQNNTQTLSTYFGDFMNTFNTTYEGYRNQISTLQTNDTTDRQYVNNTFLAISTYLGNFPNATVAIATQYLNASFLRIDTYSDDFPNSTVQNNLVAWNATYNSSYNTLLSNAPNTTLSGYNNNFPNTTITTGNLQNWNATYNTTYEGYRNPIIELQQNDTLDRDFVNATFLKINTYLTNFPNDTVMTIQTFLNATFLRTDTYSGNFPNASITSENFVNWNSTYNTTYEGYRSQIFVLQQNDSQDQAYVNTTFVKIIDFNSTINVSIDRILSNYSNNLGWINNTTMNKNLADFTNTPGYITSTYNVTYDQTTLIVNGNLANWNNTYNASYLKIDTYSGNFPNATLTSENFLAWNNTYNSTYDTTTLVVNGNLTDWNSTYNASYLRIDTYNDNFPNSTVPSLQYLVNNSGFVSNITIDRDLNNYTNSLNWVNNTTSTKYNATYQNNTQTLSTYFADFMNTFNQTYQDAYVTIQNNLIAWNLTYNTTYEGYRNQIFTLQSNDTTDRQYVNTTFLPISTYNGDFPNSTVANNTINWNNTYNSTYNVLLTNAPNTTITSENLLAWNSTYNSSYLTNITSDKNLLNFTNTPQFVTNLTMFNSTFNQTYQNTYVTQQNNLANWNATYNTSYQGMNITMQNNLQNWNNTYNSTYEGFRTSKEPTITGSTNNVFWNGLKNWISLTYQNITGFNSTVQNIIDTGGYVTNVTSTKFNATYQNNTQTLSTYFEAFMSTFNQTYQDTYVTVQNNLVNWNNTYNSTYDSLINNLSDVGLVLNMKFDENSTGSATSTKIHDSSKFSNDGTWYGNVIPNYTSGKYGTALNFDGVNDYVNAGNNASLNITNAITVSAWVYTNGTPDDYDVFVSKSFTQAATPYYEYVLGMSTDQKVRFAVTTGGVSTNVISNSAIPNQTWIHVSGVYNGSTLNIYVNGIRGTPVSKTGTINLYGRPLTVGRYEIGNSLYFNGLIDEVRIYNRALSQTEITALYNSNPLSDKSSFVQTDNFRIVNNTGYANFNINSIGSIYPLINNTASIGSASKNYLKVWATTFAGGEFADKAPGGYDYTSLWSWDNYDNYSIPIIPEDIKYSAVQLNTITGKWNKAIGFGSINSVAIIPDDIELIVDGRLVILGGYKAQVYGTINIGDKLIVSNRAGVLTNARGLTVLSLQYVSGSWQYINLPITTDPNLYNRYDSAQGVAATVVAIALQSYNSTNTGIINVKVLNT